jgi:hypothetical protein
MNAAPVTLKRGSSQATLVSHVDQTWEVQWRLRAGAPGFAVLNRGVPLQVALNPDESAEFFYRKLGASSDWIPVVGDDS